MRRSALHAVASLAAFWLGTTAASAQAAVPVTPMTPDQTSYRQIQPSADFTRRDVMVPMHDGTKRYTVIMMKNPAQADTRHPLIHEAGILPGA